MRANKKILDRVLALKAMGQAMVENASKLEQELLAGEGKKPASTRKGEVAKYSAMLITNRNKAIYKK